MKFTLFQFRGFDRSGIILLVVLWIMAIVSILAVGLGRRTGIDLSLTKYSIGKLKSRSFAWAGLMYAADQIKKDTEDPVSSEYDTLYECAVKIEKDKKPEDIFKNVRLEEGYFDIGYTSDQSENSREIYYGLEDEERKINLNALTVQNYKVLSNLIVLLGFDDEIAEIIASSVVDWQDRDSTVTNPPYGAEDNEYLALPKPYHCKNSPFENIEELLLIKGMTPEIFLKIKNYITVFPNETSNLLINIDTASEIVIRALARSVTGPLTNTEISDADSMATKLTSYRRGGDNKEFTADDRTVNANELGLNTKEMVIFFAIKGRATNVSHYLRMKVRGADQSSSIDSHIEAVMYRDDLSIVFFRRD